MNITMWPPTGRLRTHVVRSFWDGTATEARHYATLIGTIVLWIAATVCMIVTLVLSCQHIGKANGDEVAWHDIWLVMVTPVVMVAFTTWAFALKHRYIVTSRAGSWRSVMEDAGEAYRTVGLYGSKELCDLTVRLVRELTDLYQAHPRLEYSSAKTGVYVEQSKRVRALQLLAEEARQERIVTPVVDDTTLLAVEATLAARAELKQIMGELP